MVYWVSIKLQPIKRASQYYYNRLGYPGNIRGSIRRSLHLSGGCEKEQLCSRAAEKTTSLITAKIFYTGSIHTGTVCRYDIDITAAA
jgi:hypothetical protein